MGGRMAPPDRDPFAVSFCNAHYRIAAGRFARSGRAQVRDAIIRPIHGPRGVYEIFLNRTWKRGCWIRTAPA